MKFPTSVAGKLGRPMLKLRKISPQIMFGAGVVGVVGAGVLACRATLKLDETLEKDVTRQLTIQQLTSDGAEGYEAEKYDRHIAHAKARLILDIAKLYAPAVGLTVVSIGLLTGSHVTLNRRNAAATAAYATLDQAYKRYRDGVIEKYGKGEDERFRHGVVEVGETVTVDGDSKKTKVVKHERSAGRSEYAQCFEESNVNWRPGGNANWFFLNAQEKYWNDQLQTIGYVFLNDVLKSLGLQETKAGQVVGWVAGENKGDGYISFGIFENERSEAVRDFMTGAEDSIWLDFNVDGMVLDLAF
jgi:hypothetical protein